MNQLFRSFRYRTNLLFNAFRIDPEIYPLMIILTGGVAWTGYFYSRKFLWDLDSSHPFQAGHDITPVSKPLEDVLKGENLDSHGHPFMENRKSFHK